MGSINTSAVGFRYHRSKKWQSARAFSVSLFAFGVLCWFIVSDGKPLREELIEHPAWFFAGALFLFFTTTLAIQLVHVLRTPLVLEFAANELIDRRLLRTRRIAYRDIEIFSPKPDRIFEAEPMIACRLVGDATADFVFFERVETPSHDEQRRIIERLLANVSRFEFLTSDDGDDVGEFDETNA